MRHGTAYRTMKAVESVKHVSDLGKLPQGAEFVKTVTRYAYEQTVRVVEHEYHLVTYRLNGVMYTAYLPAEGEPEVIDRVPNKGIGRLPGIPVIQPFLSEHTPLSGSETSSG